ncbi:glutamate dehydrogenase [Nonlabens mediterrranea]|uniref:Glutamate dehydrogenase n=1 Tax=Nonlabens mediterrranea TaxID=1419947 RepID=A0ABS0A391_9FLAO|nr:glutamate dehydrogenase [Nonlabens mediterrranea]
MIKTLRFIGFFIALICAAHMANAQLGISHEVGIIAGPVAFQSDYGERYDWSTNKGNIGTGIGLVHYINFAYRADCNCYTQDTYWNDHFKIRNQLAYHVTTLDHLSELADRPSLAGLQLRSMTGKAKVFEIGTHLEWFPLSIRDFQEGQPKFAPYFGIGAHYVNYRPEATSELGPLNNPVTTYPTFIDRIDTSQGSTFALVGDIGFRYKISELSDLLVSSAWHYYDSNYVDGLSPRNVNNRSYDFIWWFNVGYIYYL